MKLHIRRLFSTPMRLGVQLSWVGIKAWHNVLHVLREEYLDLTSDEEDIPLTLHEKVTLEGYTHALMHEDIRTLRKLFESVAHKLEVFEKRTDKILIRLFNGTLYLFDCYFDTIFLRGESPIKNSTPPVPPSSRLN